MAVRKYENANPPQRFTAQIYEGKQVFRLAILLSFDL
jgi:hypothetical protein